MNAKRRDASHHHFRWKVVLAHFQFPPTQHQRDQSSPRISPSTPVCTFSANGFNSDTCCLHHIENYWISFTASPKMDGRPNQPCDPSFHTSYTFHSSHFDHFVGSSLKLPLLRPCVLHLLIPPVEIPYKCQTSQLFLFQLFFITQCPLMIILSDKPWLLLLHFLQLSFQL